MIISEAWLREWVSTRLDTDALSRKLTMAGLEIGSVETAGTAPAKVVVGKIQAIEPHPRADRLRVCTVDVGRARPLQIVCGAANAAEGLKVAVALIGTELPGGLKIEKSRIRDVVSSGMLCSASELGLAENSGGIMELDPRAKVGENFAEHFKLDDQLLEVELTPNRGDCLSIEGVARELSALTGATLKTPAVPSVRAETKTKVPVKLGAPKDCPRFAGRTIEGIDAQAETPTWMVEKLRRVGIRSVSIVVDITNYVMIELGQPMHAFDFDKLTGGIQVRRATKGEKLKLLDGSSVKADEDVLVIADDSGAIALAGIMGGDSTSIGDNTTNIMFEAAFFTPAVSAGRARRFGMHTDASHRFERGVDPTQQVRAIERATALVVEIAGGSPGPVVEAVSKRYIPARESITLRAERLERMLGREYKRDQVEKILKGLGMSVRSNRTSFKVVPPTWRFDITGEHDLVEEVARVAGYGEIPARAPRVAASETLDNEAILPLERVSDVLVDRGFREAITYTFVDPELQERFFPQKKAIALDNPIASNLAVMRLALAPGLLQAVVGNYNRQHRRIRLFESGSVFKGTLRRRKEVQMVGGIATGPVRPADWSAKETPMDFFDIKGDVEALLALAHNPGVRFVPSELGFLHPGQGADIQCGSRTIGYVGQLHPALIRSVEIDQPVFAFEVESEFVQAGEVANYRAVSRFPATRRDLAIVVAENVSVGDVLETAQKAAGSLLVNLELFDIYRGEGVDSGTKSVAFGLTLQDSSRTLREAEVDAIVDDVLAALKGIGGELRR